MRKILKKTLVIVLICSVFYINLVMIQEIMFQFEYGSSVATEQSEKIGIISLYASPIPIPTISRPIGHSFIVIENTSDKSFSINGAEVMPNESISLGTTAVPSLEHRGIWKNIEGYNKYYLENIAISGDFYAEDLDYLDNYLKEHDKWTLAYNCVSFAVGVWNNSLSGSFEQFRAITPIQLYIKILNSDNNKLDKELNKQFEIVDYPLPYESKHQ